MQFVVKTPSTFLPVTLAEAKNQLGITHNLLDDLITAKIKAARDWCESFTGLTVMETTFIAYLDEWSTRIVLWDHNPIIEIVSIKYLDTGDQEQTLDTSKYKLIKGGQPSQIYIDEMPSLSSKPQSIIIEFKSGMADPGSAEETQRAAVPDNFREAVLTMMTSMVEKREDAQLDPATVRVSEMLLTPLKIHWV